MLFQEKFNEVCKFPDYYVDCFEDVADIEWKVKNFNEAYPDFKKEHGLENLYFSTVICFENKGDMIIEVWYEISDLYLTYLEANDSLPEGALVERYLIKEQYLLNTDKEWLFRDSIFSAQDQQTTPKIVNGCKVYDTWEGLTERIKLSNPSNGLPGMIVERIPMTYDDLKNLSSN